MQGNRALVDADAQDVLADGCVMYGYRAFVDTDAQDVLADAYSVNAD